MSVDKFDSRLALFAAIAALLNLAFTQTLHADDYNTSTTSTKLFDSPGPVTWEVRTAPIAFLARWYTVDIAYVFGEQFATGPSAIFYNGGNIGNMLSPTYNGEAVGWSAVYYFKPIHLNGTYLGTRAYYDNYENYPHGAPQGDFDKVEGLKANLVYGYHTHLSVFSISMGLGLEYRDYNVTIGKRKNNSSTDKDDYGNRSGVIPYAEFKIGIEI